jgi:hypothetical protein
MSVETNTFKLILNDDLKNMVEIYEKILSRDADGAVKQVEYDIWHHHHRLHCGIENCGEAFTLAAEIALDATSK